MIDLPRRFHPRNGFRKPAAYIRVFIPRMQPMPTTTSTTATPIQWMYSM
jgi:hypothetical protein